MCNIEEHYVSKKAQQLKENALKVQELVKM
jgi:hypothetical protein